jgi:hypothetical protein
MNITQKDIAAIYFKAVSVHSLGANCDMNMGFRSLVIKSTEKKVF